MQTVLSTVTYVTEELALAKCRTSNTEWSLIICTGTRTPKIIIMEGQMSFFIRRDIDKKHAIKVRPPGLKH
jgi:hypothetical protein